MGTGNLARLFSDGTGLGQDLISPNCKYRLHMQGDGNLVLHRRDWESQYSIVKWASNTRGQGTPPYHIVIQKNNNLNIFDSQRNKLWETYTNHQGAPGAKAKLHDDGIFVVYDGNGVALWSTHTAGPKGEY